MSKSSACKLVLYGSTSFFPSKHVILSPFFFWDPALYPPKRFRFRNKCCDLPKQTPHTLLFRGVRYFFTGNPVSFFISIVLHPILVYDRAPQCRRPGAKFVPRKSNDLPTRFPSKIFLNRPCLGVGFDNVVSQVERREKI